MNIKDVFEMLTQLSPSYASLEMSRYWDKSKTDSESIKSFKYKKRKIKKEKKKVLKKHDQ